MDVYCRPDGQLLAVYDELVDLSPLGQPTITRASHVEPNKDGQWLADLSPVAGPILGPFNLRSQALAAEVAWLTQYFNKGTSLDECT